MTPEEAQRLEACVQEIAAILYKNTPVEALTSLEGIEKAVRQHMAEQVSLEVSVFCPASYALKSRQTPTDQQLRLKVGGSLKRLQQAESYLWHSQVELVKQLFQDQSKKQARNFCAYLDKHRHSLVNYACFQSEQLCSIGSEAVESGVKQIDRRLKLSGAH